MALLWSGLSLSAIGDQLYTVALAWVAVEAFGARAGYLSALSALCVLVTALASGHWADQWDRRRTMIGADLVRAAILLGLVAVWAGAGHAPASGLVVAVIVLGAGQALFRPALQAVLPGCVPDRALLPAANGLMDTTERTARLLGPGFVALLGGIVPVMHFFTLDAATFFVSALAVARIGPVASARAGLRGSMVESVLRGFRVVWRHRVLRLVLIFTGPLNGAWFVSLLLGVPLLVSRLGVTGPGGTGLGAFGLVISSYGVGNLVATLVLGSRPMPERPAGRIFRGALVLGFGALLFAFIPLLPPALRLPGFAIAAAIEAVGGPMQDIATAVLRQTELPPADIPAAMRAFLVLSNAGMLIAMLAAPGLFALIGLPASLALCALVIAATGAIGLALRSWTGR
jgi:MFS transporter, DHA3 family, macrolide efflux protein